MTHFFSRPSRRTVVLGMASAVLTLGTAFTPAVFAQAYPQRPVTLVVPNAAGGAADLLARGVAEQMSKQLKQPVIVENMGGASGAIAAQKVLRSTPDGYTLLFGTTSDVVVTPLTVTSAGYSTKDFTPIGQVGVTPMTLVATNRLKITNIDQLIALAREKPGQLSIGTTGSASLQAFAAAAVMKAANIDLIPVAYRGGAPIATDLISGQIDLAVMAMPGALPHARAGRLALLGVLAPQRASVAADVPSVNESTQVDGVAVEIWAGLLGPANLPAPIVERLNAAIQAMLQDPEFAAWRTARGDMPVTPRPAADFARFVASEEAAYRALSASLKAE